MLDLRSTSPRQWVGAVLEQFGQLQAGTGLVLCCDASPQPVLHELQQLHGDVLEWHPLVDGPPLWQTILGRRHTSAIRRGVMALMTADHRRIHDLLQQIVDHARRRDHDALTTTLQHFETGLRKHIQMEEELLFPVISSKLGTPRGPAVVLREEHVAIQELLASLWDGCRSSAPDRDLTDTAQVLQNLLENHSGIEERILYAVTDLLLTNDERLALIKQCQQL